MYPNLKSDTIMSIFKDALCMQSSRSVFTAIIVMHDFGH